MGKNYLAGEQLPASELNQFVNAAGLYAASATGNDSYSITVSPVPTSYTSGDSYMFKADVANTDTATLNVNGLGAKTIKKNGTLNLETGDIKAGQICRVTYDGTYFQLTSAITPPNYFQQEVPVGAVLTGTQNCGSNSTGSVFYIHDGGTDTLKRFQRDSLTGQYFLTHSVAVTDIGYGQGGIVEIGSYIYLITDSSGANIIGQRFLASDLTGQTTLTLPAVASSSAICVWTNGTDIYVISDSSSTTSRRWTISGTTLTAAGTATVSSSLQSGVQSSMWDGTTAYLCRYASGVHTVDKLTAIDGSSYTESTKNSGTFNNGEIGTVILNIDTTKIYIGHKTDNFNATVAAASVIHLIPISKP